MSLTTKKTVKSVIIDGTQYSPSSDSWEFPFVNESKELTKYSDGNSSVKIIPESSVVTGEILAPTDMAKITETAKRTDGFTSTIFAYDGSRCQVLGGVVQNNAAVNSDGNIPLEIAGEVKWL